MHSWESRSWTLTHTSDLQFFACKVFDNSKYISDFSRLNLWLHFWRENSNHLPIFGPIFYQFEIVDFRHFSLNFRIFVPSATKIDPANSNIVFSAKFKHCENQYYSQNLYFHLWVHFWRENSNYRPIFGTIFGPIIFRISEFSCLEWPDF